MAHTGDRGMGGEGINNEALRNLGYHIPVAHPYRLLLLQPLSQLVACGELHVSLAVFPLRGPFHLAVQLECHQLHAVADAQHRNAQIVDSRVNMRRPLRIHTGRPSGEYNALRRKRLEPVQRNIVRQQFAVHSQIPDTSCNQLVVLAAKVQHDNDFIRLHHLPALSRTPVQHGHVHIFDA
ncbi:hypothetical protein D3C75_690160 [compost metagenome]